MAGVGLDGVQRDEQALADLLVRAALGDQFQHCQLTTTERLARAAARRGLLGQTSQQLDLDLAGRTCEQLLAKPQRVQLDQPLKRLHHPALGRCQSHGQALGSLRLATVLQGQGDPLAQRAQGQHHATAGLPALDQAAQARSGILTAALDAFEQGLLQLDVQR
ncbi:hypothetical protein D3C73_1130980 [compost metagenome]